MKKIISLLIVILFIGAQCFLIEEFDMSNEVTIEYNHEKTWTTTTNNCVGPCSDTSIRSGFDCGASGTTYNNSNTRFFKTTGSSSNTGLYASPLDTLDNAIAKAITDSKSNVVCLDSGTYEGVITSAIPANFKIVAANGQTPKLKWGANLKISTSFGRYNVVNSYRMPMAYSGNNLMRIAIQSSSNGLYTSTDNGSTWTAISAPTGSGAIDSICMGSSGRVILGCHGGVYISDNWGSTWTHKVGSWDILSIFRDSDGKIYATQSNDFHTSTDNGSTWTTTTNILPAAIKILTILKNNRMFIVGGSPMAIYYSDDHKTFTECIIPGYNSDNVVNIVEFNNALYMLMSRSMYVVMKSIDGGHYWERDDSFYHNSGGGLQRYLYVYNNKMYYLVNTTVSGFPGATLYTYRDNTIIELAKYNTQLEMNTAANNRLYFAKYVLPTWKESYISLSFLQMLNNNLEINGFYLDGNNKQALDIISGTGSQTGLTLKYCSFDNYYYAAVENVDDATLTVQHCTFNGGEYGIK